MNERGTYPALYSETFPIEWNAADVSGRLSLTGLFNIVQLVAAHHADRCRFGFYQMREAGQAWVLNRLRIRFRDLPLCDRQVRATTWIQATNGVVSQRCMQLECDGRTFAQVSTVWVCIDCRKRTAQHIAIDYPSYLVLPDRAPALPSPRRLDIPERTRLMRRYKAVFSDIDAMGHVNNTKYTQWILDSLPFRMAAALTSGEAEANFSLELHPGDTVSIERSVEDRSENAAPRTFVIRRETDCRVAFTARYTPIDEPEK